jgi:hypothetical protein
MKTLMQTGTFLANRKLEENEVSIRRGVLFDSKLLPCWPTGHQKEHRRAPTFPSTKGRYLPCYLLSVKLPSFTKTHIFHIMLPHMDKIYPMLTQHLCIGPSSSFSHSSSGIMEHYKIHYQIIHIVGAETIARIGILTNCPLSIG